MTPLIEFSLPASADFVSLIRQVAAAACVRADFTVDGIDDAKLACDEAATIVIQNAHQGSHFRWALNVQPKILHVHTSAPTALTALPNFAEQEGFTWTVINAVTHDLNIELIDGEIHIDFYVRDAIS